MTLEWEKTRIQDILGSMGLTGISSVFWSVASQAGSTTSEKCYCQRGSQNLKKHTSQPSPEVRQGYFPFYLVLCFIFYLFTSCEYQVLVFFYLFRFYE